MIKKIGKYLIFGLIAILLIPATIVTTVVCIKKCHCIKKKLKRAIIDKYYFEVSGSDCDCGCRAAHDESASKNGDCDETHQGDSCCVISQEMPVGDETI